MVTDIMSETSHIVTIDADTLMTYSQSKKYSNSRLCSILNLQWLTYGLIKYYAEIVLSCTSGCIVHSLHSN